MHKIMKKDGYIVGAVKTPYGTDSEEAYNAVINAFHNAPTAPKGYACRLREDLTWEFFELPPEPETGATYSEDDLLPMSAAELSLILSGMGISASMTKANMIRLILASQEL